MLVAYEASGLSEGLGLAGSFRGWACLGFIILLLTRFHKWLQEMQDRSLGVRAKNSAHAVQAGYQESFRADLAEIYTLKLYSRCFLGSSFTSPEPTPV